MNNGISQFTPSYIYLKKREKLKTILNVIDLTMDNHTFFEKEPNMCLKRNPIDNLGTQPTIKRNPINFLYKINKYCLLEFSLNQI